MKLSTLKKKTGIGMILLCSLLIAHYSLSCENPMINDILSDYYGTVNNPASVKDFLYRRHGGWTVDSPVTMRMEMPLSQSNWEEMFKAIGTSGKFINLDLSACTPDNTADDPILYYDEEDDFGNTHVVFDPKKSVENVENSYSNIVSIILPDAATKIQGYSTQADYGAFKSFNNLRYVTGNNILVIGEYAFQDRSELRSIDFPKVIMIEQGAFNANNGSLILKEITIPASCIYIASQAFQNCLYLTAVTFLGSNCEIDADDSFQEGSSPDASSLKTAYESINDRFPGTYRFNSFTGWSR